MMIGLCNSFKFSMEIVFILTPHYNIYSILKCEKSIYTDNNELIKKCNLFGYIFGVNSN